MVPAPHRRRVLPRPDVRSVPRADSMVAFSRPSPGADWPRGRLSRDPRACGLGGGGGRGPRSCVGSRHRGALGKMAPAGPLLSLGGRGLAGSFPWSGGSAGFRTLRVAGRRWACGERGRALGWPGPRGGPGRGGGWRAGSASVGGGVKVGVPRWARVCRSPVCGGSFIAPPPPPASRRVVGSGVNAGPGSDRPLSRPRSDPASRCPTYPGCGVVLAVVQRRKKRLEVGWC